MTSKPFLKRSPSCIENEESRDLEEKSAKRGEDFVAFRTKSIRLEVKEDEMELIMTGVISFEKEASSSGKKICLTFCDK